MMSKRFALVGLMLLCLSVPLFADSLVIGNFEGGSPDGWAASGTASISNSLTGNTRGLASMKVEFADGWGDVAALTIDFGTMRDILTKENSKITMDITARSNDIDSCNIGMIFNVENYWGVVGETALILGSGSEYATATYEIVLPEDLKTAITTATWGQFQIFRNTGDTSCIMYVDNIQIVYGSDDSVPFNPSPADDDGTLVSIDQVLSWNAALDPTTSRPFTSIRKHYIMSNFNNEPGDPNLYYMAEVDAETISATDPNIVETAQYPLTGSLALENGRVYKWQIIEGMANGGGVYPPEDTDNNIVGPEWTFETEPAYYAPEIALQNIITTLDIVAEAPVDISAAVTKNTADLTSASVSLVTDDFQFPAAAVYTFVDTTTDYQNPTATFATDIAGSYIIKVSATDTEGTTVDKYSEITIFEDGCAAKKDGRSSGWEQNHFDMDGDCDVDIADFAVVAAQWMADSSLTASESYAGSILYVPVDVFNARVEAESVDVEAVSDPPVDDEVGIRILEKTAIGNNQVLGWTGWGTYAEYDIDVDAAVYDLWVSSASPNADVILSFGDATTIDLYGSVAVATSGGWDVFAIDTFTGALDFTATAGGTITVRVTWPQGGSDLDWFVLVKQ